MGSSLYIFSGPKDYQELEGEIRRRGLHMYPILMEQPELALANDPAARPFCFLSHLARHELHPYGNPPRICDATDPLLSFMRPYFKPPDLLVMGRIHCSADVPKFYDVMMPYFRGLAGWVKAHWEKLDSGEYIGPEATTIRDAGARLVTFPPNVPIERI